MVMIKKDKKSLDVEVTFTVTFREPDGSESQVINGVQVWLTNRLLHMKNCQSVDIKDVRVTPVTIEARHRG